MNMKQADLVKHRIDSYLSSTLSRLENKIGQIECRKDGRIKDESYMGYIAELIRAELANDYPINTALNVCLSSSAFSHVSEKNIRDIVKRVQRSVSDKTPLGKTLLSSEMLHLLKNGYQTNDCLFEPPQHKNAIVRPFYDDKKERADLIKAQAKYVEKLKQLIVNRGEPDLIRANPYIIKKYLTQWFYYYFSGQDKNGQFIGYPFYYLNDSNLLTYAGYHRNYYPTYFDADNKRTRKQSYAINAQGHFFGFFPCFTNAGISDKSTLTGANSICIVCEGQHDAIVLSQATGIDVYTAEGTRCLIINARILKRKYQHVIICTDNDKGGQSVIDECSSEFKVITPTSTKDFGQVYVDAYLINQDINQGLKAVRRELGLNIAPFKLILIPKRKESTQVFT